MAQLTGTVPVLTALIEAGLDEARSEVRFALEMMEESRITVSRANDMARIAEVARRELGV
jgi:hypothetical protein